METEGRAVEHACSRGLPALAPIDLTPVFPRERATGCKRLPGRQARTSYLVSNSKMIWWAPWLSARRARPRDFVIPYVAWGLEDPSIMMFKVAKEVAIDVTTVARLSWQPAS